MHPKHTWSLIKQSVSAWSDDRAPGMRVAAAAEEPQRAAVPAPTPALAAVDDAKRQAARERVWLAAAAGLAHRRPEPRRPAKKAAARHYLRR